MAQQNSAFKVYCKALFALSVMLPFSAQAEDMQKQKQNMTQTQASQPATDEPAKKQPTKEELFSPQSISKLSETYGYLIEKSLENPILKLNMDEVIKGMQDAKAGKSAPMTEEEYEEAISLIQEYAFQDMAAKNLNEAEKFLSENAKKSGVVVVEPGKLQYMVLQPGKGETVAEGMLPSIKYTGKYIDGNVFGSSDANGGNAIPISLSHTIPGFRKAILGMKVGEKRRIFIHPDFGYGTSGQLLPNALLIFDVEVTDVKPEPKEEKEENADNMTGDADYDYNMDATPSDDEYVSQDDQTDQTEEPQPEPKNPTAQPNYSGSNSQPYRDIPGR